MRANFARLTHTAAFRLAMLALFAVLSANFVAGQSQSNAADLRGIVSDPNGAVVAGANVTVRNNEFGVTRTATTDESGEYRIVNLPPGVYEVAVEAANFKRAVFQNVQLTVGQAADLNATLELGEATATVTITDATAEVVETTKTAVSTTIDQQRIENLPINQRDYLGFTLTTSSVGRDNGRPIGPAPTSGLNFGGQRGRSNLVQVDGADNTDNSVNAARTTVSQEAVQEFQVVTNSFAPEFGRSAGGVVNVVTKRGTNEFRGNVFGFLRDKRIQARAPFAPEKSAFTRTQFGVTLGGPIVKEKTFFFFAFERRQRNESGYFTTDVAQGLTSSVTVGAPFLPFTQTFTRLSAQQAQYAQSLLATGNAQLATLALNYLYLASSGSNTGLTGNNPLVSAGGAIPAGQPVGQRFFLSGAPVPVGTVGSNGQPIAFRPLLDLQRVFPIYDRSNFTSIRVDHNFNDRNQLQTRFGYNPGTLTGIQVESQNQALGQNDFSRTGIQTLKDYSFLVGLNSTFGSAVNEFRFNFGKRDATFRSQNGEAVAFNISGTAFIGRELFSPVDRTENRYQIADNVTFVAGNHTLKFGADFNWVNIPNALFELNFAGLFNFGQLSAATLGLPAQVQTSATTVLATPAFTPVQAYGLGFPSNFIQGFGNPVSSYKNQPIAFFAQDSWKATQRLTLNYGVRYDVELTEQKAPVDFLDPLTGIQLTAADILAAQDVLNVQQGIPRDYNNIAPRAGFAYDVFGNARTVVRGAIGLFYDHPLLAVAFNSDIADAAQQQQAVLTPGSPTPTALLNSTQVFQGTVCGAGFQNPLCPAGLRTPGLAATAQYQLGRQRFNDQTFTGFGTVLPFSLPVAKDFEYAYATQANVAFEQQLTKDMSISASYLFVGARHLPHPTDLNAPRVDLQIQNFQRFSGGRLPTSTTEVVTGVSIASTAPGSTFANAYGVTCGVVIPGMIAQCPNGRVVNPAIANFFRPNAPNYFLATALSGGGVTKAVLDSQLAGSLRTPGLLTPFGSVNAQVSDGRSNYNALTLDLRRRFANNFQFLASYTLSKSMDDSSDLQTLLIPQDPRNLRADYSRSLFDQRHRFVFSGVLTSPAAWRSSGSGFKRVFADFTIAPILELSSGRPFNILTNVDTNNDQSSSTDRPDVRDDGTLCASTDPTIAPGQPCSLFDLDQNGALVFGFGNLPRNSGDTRPYASLDLRLTRAIRFGERVRLDLIAEGFNLFNRFNQAAASPFFDDVNNFGTRRDNGRYTGRATAAFDQRQFQLGFKLNF